MDCRFLLHGIAVRIGTESQGDCTIGKDIHNVWYVLYYKKDKKKKKNIKKTGVDCWEVFDTHKPPPQIFFQI